MKKIVEHGDVCDEVQTFLWQTPLANNPKLLSDEVDHALKLKQADEAFQAAKKRSQQHEKELEKKGGPVLQRVDSKIERDLLDADRLHRASQKELKGLEELLLEQLQPGKDAYRQVYDAAGTFRSASSALAGH